MRSRDDAKKSRLISDDTPDNLVAKLGYQYVLSFESSMSAADITAYFNSRGFPLTPIADDITPNKFYIQLNHIEDHNKIVSLMDKQPDTFRSLNSRKANMSNVYEAMYQKEGESC